MWVRPAAYSMSCRRRSGGVVASRASSSHLQAASPLESKVMPCCTACCICMPWSPKVCLVALHALESKGSALTAGPGWTVTACWSNKWICSWSCSIAVQVTLFRDPVPTAMQAWTCSTSSSLSLASRQALQQAQTDSRPPARVLHQAQGPMMGCRLPL